MKTLNQFTNSDLLKVMEGLFNIGDSAGIEGVKERFYQAVQNYQLAHVRTYKSSFSELVSLSMMYAAEQTGIYIQECAMNRNVQDGSLDAKAEACLNTDFGRILIWDYKCCTIYPADESDKTNPSCFIRQRQKVKTKKGDYFAICDRPDLEEGVMMQPKTKTLIPIGKINLRANYFGQGPDKEEL